MTSPLHLLGSCRPKTFVTFAGFAGFVMNDAFAPPARLVSPPKTFVAFVAFVAFVGFAINDGSTRSAGFGNDGFFWERSGAACVQGCRIGTVWIWNMSANRPWEIEP